MLPENEDYTGELSSDDESDSSEESSGYVYDRYERELIEDPLADDDDDLEEDEPEDTSGLDTDEIVRESLAEEAALGEDVGLNGPNVAREPATWFLSGRLKAFYRLWGTSVPGSYSDPWSLYWRDHPEHAALVEADLDAEIAGWVEKVQALDVEAVKTENGETTRKAVYDLSQKQRTLVLLCYPVTCALSLAAYATGSSEPLREFLREFREHETFRLFEKLRTYVYQTTAHYKVKKREYDRERTKRTTEERAARRRVQTAREAQDPTFNAREAARKRLLRQKLKALANTLKDV